MRTNEIFALNGVEQMTNKEMLFFGLAHIANRYGVEFDGADYDGLQMVHLRGEIKKECALDVRELATDLLLIDAEHECKMTICREYGVSLIFDENWDRRVGNKRFKALLCEWYKQSA